MTKASKRFVREMADLIDATEELCEVLQRYRAGSAEVSARVDQGELLADALRAAGGPVRRVEVTDSVAKFEAARHQVRLAMFALGSEQGTSASEVGRQLGISRQLAARLANEAKETIS